MPERANSRVGAKHFAAMVAICLDQYRMTFGPSLCRKMFCPYMAYRALQPDFRHIPLDKMLDMC
jgi:hypothetical protein